MIFSLLCRYPEIPNIHCTFLILLDINIHCHIKDIHVCMYVYIFFLFSDMANSSVKFDENGKHKERTTSRRSRLHSPRSGSRNENLSVMPNQSPGWLYDQEHSSRIDEEAARTKAWILHKMLYNVKNRNGFL